MSQPFPPKPEMSPDALPPHGVDPNQPMMGPPSKDECTMAMLAHLLGALLSFLGPLIIWLMKKDESAFVNDQGKEALNFQLTLLIAQVVAVVIATATCGLLFFLPFIPWLVQIIMGILGAVEANKGIAYRYPFTWRMIS
jgi:uncharacterized Tic20 family protein